MEPNEQNNEAQASRLGAMVVVALVLGLPLLLAYLFAAWSMAAAAWHLLISQITG